MPRRTNLRSLVNCIGTTGQCGPVGGEGSQLPTIVQFSNSGAQFLIGKGVSKEKQQGAILGGIAGAHYVDAAAKAYGVSVILNTDHCARKLLPWVEGLLAASGRAVRQDGKAALQLAYA